MCDQLLCMCVCFPFPVFGLGGCTAVVLVFMSTVLDSVCVGGRIHGYQEVSMLDWCRVCIVHARVLPLCCTCMYACLVPSYVLCNTST